MLLPTDPKKTSWLVDARVTQVEGGMYLAKCAQMPEIAFKGATVREAVMGMSAAVASVIRGCRTAETKIPWVEAGKVLRGESSYRAQVVMKPYDPHEKFYVDQVVCLRARNWARLGRSGSVKRIRKQRRKLAVRLREIGRREEAAHVLERGFEDWEDPACLTWEADPTTGRNLGIRVESDNIRQAVASFRENNPHVVMKAWWLRVQMRMTTERQLVDPRNIADVKDCKRWDDKSRQVVEMTVDKFRKMTPAERAEYVAKEQAFIEMDRRQDAAAHKYRQERAEFLRQMLGSVKDVAEATGMVPLVDVHVPVKKEAGGG